MQGHSKVRPLVAAAAMSLPPIPVLSVFVSILSPNQMRMTRCALLQDELVAEVRRLYALNCSQGARTW